MPSKKTAAAIDEWQTELDRANQDNADPRIKTCAEIAEKFGWKIDRTRNYLNKRIKEGAIERLPTFRKLPSGKLNYQTGYRIIKSKK